MEHGLREFARKCGTMIILETLLQKLVKKPFEASMALARLKVKHMTHTHHLKLSDKSWSMLDQLRTTPIASTI